MGGLKRLYVREKNVKPNHIESIDCRFLDSAGGVMESRFFSFFLFHYTKYTVTYISCKILKLISLSILFNLLVLFG